MELHRSGVPMWSILRSFALIREEVVSHMQRFSRITYFASIAIASVAFMLTSVTPHADAAESALHIQTFVKLPGDFTQRHNTSWDTLARYISYLDTDARAANDAHQAGIRVGFYTDVHLICAGSDCSGSPKPAQVSESGYAHDCHGRRVYTPDDSSAVKKMLGTPESPALVRAFNDQIDDKLHDAYGYNHYDFVFDDDVFLPDASWYTWHSGSPRGSVLHEPYCHFNRARYIAGIKNIEAKAHLPVIFNGLNGPENIAYIQRVTNVIGGMCEDCIHVDYDKNRNREAMPLWGRELDAALAAGARHMLWIDYPHGAIDNDTQGYLYASLMLAYTPGSTTLDEDIHTPSQVPLPPTILLVPHQPLGRTPLHISDLLQNGGAYARRFNKCTIAGMNVGPCAAAVNPDPGKSVRLPDSLASYRHSLVIEGSGVVHELGDTGVIRSNGPRPPKYIGPRGWVIAFQ